ncbi:MAG: glutaminase A [Opitutales bacterium]|nr:glutaminase A [Opitutales bacterium]
MSHPFPYSLETVVDEVFLEAAAVDDGDVTTYIPELARVDPALIGLSVCDGSGAFVERGDSGHYFTLQSISKVLGYACVLEIFDDETIARHVGVEPTGEDFDSIIKLDRHKRPFNPMVNAGAIAVTDLLLTRFGGEAVEQTLAFFAQLLGRKDLVIDEAVYESEQRTGERNRAIAHLLKNFAILENSVEEVLALYFRHCAVQVTTGDLARLGMTLANGGCTPGGGDPVLCPETLRKLLSVTLTCGMYNYAGQWVYEVGFPAKSGVSGGMLGIVPGRYGIGVFSPRVDEKGSSPRGVCVQKRLSDRLNLHMFAPD